MSEITYTIGTFADPLAKQLKGSGIASNEIQTLQADADAMTRLCVRGYVTDAQKRSMHAKFHKNMKTAFAKAQAKEVGNG